ncbi:MAG: methionyl-tRNA formyltransferase [Acidimicrobiales bacterium]
MARLVYLGTPEAAVPPLRTLVAAGHEVVLVVTRPDKRRGRGSTLLPSPVKAAAIELGLTVTDDLAECTTVDAELGVVVAYGRIIPVAILEQLPMVNLHFSLLPRWRGAAPVERALLEGDAETGVCLMAVEAGLDTGPVYAEVATAIDPEETVDELRDRLVIIGCQMLEEHVRDGRSGLPVPHEQAGTPTYAEKIQSGEFELDWSKPAVELQRVIRLGRAWTALRGKRVRVLAAGPGSAIGGGLGEADDVGEAVTLEPGELRQAAVGCGQETRLVLVEVQPEGKRPMAASAWLNGVQPTPQDRLGG